MWSDRELEDRAGELGRDQVLECFGGQVKGVFLLM